VPSCRPLARPLTTTKKRVRRTAEDARLAILDAAEKRMGEVGPAGVRLQDVAADVGVSHPTVLHHFGSREALIAAVVDRSVSALHAGLVEEIGKGRYGKEPIGEMLEAAARVLGPMGHGRIAAWLSLAGVPPDGRGRDNLEQVARAAHQVRSSLRGDATPPYEDTYFTVLLAALALFGDAIVGPMVHGPEEPGAREGEGARFRVWLAGLLEAHLQCGGEPQPNERARTTKPKK
jgi:AcrR family transcriptional regulator